MAKKRPTMTAEAKNQKLPFPDTEEAVTKYFRQMTPEVREVFRQVIENFLVCEECEESADFLVDHGTAFCSEHFLIYWEQMSKDELANGEEWGVKKI